MDEIAFRAEGTPKEVLDFVAQACTAAGLPVAARDATTVGAKRDRLFGGSDTFMAAVGDVGGAMTLMCRFEGKLGQAVAAKVSSSYRRYEPESFASRAGQPITQWPETAALHEVRVSACVFDSPEDGSVVHVVGESHYQDALLEAAGGKTESGAAVPERTALLMPEPENPYDANAVRVFMIPGGLVGYLSREDAVDYRDAIDRLALSGQVVACQAEITGGWSAGDGDDGGCFGVLLHLGDPDSLQDEMNDMEAP